MNTATAIILARAGSKGVPGKNVALVAGRPCIAWTIEAAQRATGVSRVVVSSDCPRALAVALEMGATPLRRPAELAGDTARVDDAARHAARELGLGEHARGRGGCGGRVLCSTVAGVKVVTEFRGSEGEAGTGERDGRCARDEGEGAAFVLLYANVPVRPDGLIDRALELLWSSGCDSVQSYAPVGKHHPWWTARLDGGGRVGPWEGDVLNHEVFRRQDLPAAVIPDGGVIALRREALMLETPGVPEGPHAFFGSDRRGVMTRDGEVVDIDSEIDLVVADTLLKRGGVKKELAADLRGLARIRRERRVSGR